METDREPPKPSTQTSTSDSAREPPATPFAPPFGGDKDHTDGRRPWEWESKYPKEAWDYIRPEGWLLFCMLLSAIAIDGVCFGLNGQAFNIGNKTLNIWINFRLIAVFCTGWIGSVTFSIKWLIHSVSKGKWHLDRRLWRLLTPMIGGVYACVVMTLFRAGLFDPEPTIQVVTMPATGALAFLVGYFSDGVSGLLSNVANAVFGTLERK